MVKCRHCGYEWKSFAAHLLVKCPNCGKRTPRMEKEKRRISGKYISHFAKKVEPVITKTVRSHTVLKVPKEDE